MLELRPFQREDVDAIKAHGLRVLNASAPGTGKTAVTLRALAEMAPNSLPVLVICPSSVVHNWSAEAEKWAPNTAVVLIEDMATPIPKTRKPCIYVMSWGLLTYRLEELKEARLRVLVADEAHYSKNEDAARTQALTELASTCLGVMLLTGTPIVNDEDELTTLKRILGSDEPLMLRRLLEDVAPDIPPKRRSYLYVDLRPNHRENYDRASQAFDEWLMEEKTKLLGQGAAEKEVARILAVKGFAKIGYLRRLVADYKIPAALDWIARTVRLGEPVVVFCEHQHALLKLSKYLHRRNIRHGIIDGNTTAKQRKEVVDQFQKLQFPVFIGTKAAKEGITLTQARHLLFLERFFTAADEEQAEDRIRRIGQTSETTIWFLHAVDTIDDRVDSIVRAKRRLVRSVIGSADIVRNPTEAVEALLSSWDKKLKLPKELTDLGLGEPLPPLPAPPDVHKLVFSGDEWTPASAAVWSRMNGHRPVALKKEGRAIHVETHRINEFVAHRFTQLPISPSIYAICGVRLKQKT
jgi:SNF2 family DNA or RNA helicase